MFREFVVRYWYGLSKKERNFKAVNRDDARMRAIYAGINKDSIILIKEAK